MPTELFELKVFVEADGWSDVATLMERVDEALEPHRQARDGTRRWSVVADRLHGARREELLAVIAELDARGRDERMTA